MQDAEDLEQEMVLKLWIKQNDLRDDDHEIEKYVSKTRKNKLIDFWRKRKRDPNEELKDESLQENQSGQNSLLMQMGSRDEIEKALLALPKDDREVVKLRYMEGLSIKEAAALLGISKDACAKRGTRAKKEMIKLITEAYRDED